MKPGALILLLLCLCTFSCKTRMCTYVCQDGEIHVFSKGMKLKDVDTVYLKKFLSGSFVNPVLTGTIYQDTGSWIGFNDSTLVHIVSLARGYNWELTIPGTQQIYRISDIKDEGAQTKEGECSVTQGCINQIVSYKVNDSMRSGTSFTIVK